MKRIIAWLLCLLMTVSLIPAALADGEEPAQQPEPSIETMEEPVEEPEPAEEPEPVEEPELQSLTLPDSETAMPQATATGVTSYTYEVAPILAPFPYYVYVKTDNPDPESFRLIDRDSSLYSAGSEGEIYRRTSATSGVSIKCEPGTYYVTQYCFLDVAYEDKSIARVNGGYIFEARKAFSDGGELVLQEIEHYGESIFTHKYRDTDVTVTCPKMTTYMNYLVDTYTDPSKTLFENLSSLQNGMEEISVYPRWLYDKDRPNEDTPYPYLYSSGYPEHLLMDGYDMYKRSTEDMFITKAYPYVLDSLSFPSVIWRIAKRLEPDAEIKWNDCYHWLIDVTWDGETRSFGGAGNGGTEPLYTDRLATRFTFDGSANDLACTGDFSAFVDQVMIYDQNAQDDAAYYMDLVQGSTYDAAIRATGGTWIRLRGGDYKPYYGYVVPHGDACMVASKAWVDGKYVNEYERAALNESFEDHPYADILVHDVSYVDHDGEPHTQDVIFSYDREHEDWRAPYFYSNANYYFYSWTIPDELIMSSEEAEAYVRAEIAENGNRLPTEGLCYDGTEFPGTPFSNTPVTGITLPAEYTIVSSNRSALMPVTLNPEGARCVYLTWESSDPDVATVDCRKYYGGSKIEVKKIGTTTLTATTYDGGYTATCVLHVISNIIFEEQPEDQTVKNSGSATFRVRVSLREGSMSNVTYRWESSEDGGKTWQKVYYLDGATKDTLTFPAYRFKSGTLFRCAVIEGGQTAYSNTAKFTIRTPELGSIEFADGAVGYKGDTAYVVYNGKAQKPKVVAKDTDGGVIGESRYTLTYRDNTNPGTAYADVTMNGKTVSLMFKIYLPATEKTFVENRADGIRITWNPVPGAKGYVIYRRAWNLVSAGWTTFERWNNTAGTEWTDTKVYAGTRYQYGVKAYFGNPMDNFNLGLVGPLKTTVRITTRSLRSVEPGTRQLTVKWEGSRVFTGYQVQIAADSGFTKDVQTLKITDPSVYRTTFKNLKAGKTYYARVRSYQLFDTMTYFGEWSNVTSGKVK